MKVVVFALLCVVALCSAAQITVSSGFALQGIAWNLNPTALTVAPDGRLFLCEKQGKLRLVKNNVLLDQPAVTLTNVYSNNECGLLGVVLDPDFASNGYFYLYYTYTNGSNYPRVSRFTLEADTVVPNSEVVIFELEKISTTAGVHNGGSIIIDASGKLFMFVGNTGSGSLSSSLTTSYGKVLRFNLDGSIPQDNPFYNTATGNLRAIWAYGVRNPFMAAYDPENDRIAFGDVGDGSWEEINMNTRGANFGYPSKEGFSSDPAHTNPIVAYSHDSGCAISGLAFYKSSGEEFTFPAAFNNKLYFSDYCRGWIRAVDIDATRSSNTSVDSYATFVVQGLLGALTVVQSHDGGLYLIDRGTHSGASSVNTGVTSGVLYKLIYTDSDAPAIHTQPRLPVATAVGATGVSLYVGVTGAGPLQYQWYKNNQSIPGATSDTHNLASAVTLEDDGTEFYVIVTNDYGFEQSETAVLAVSEGAPVLSISLPTDTTTYNAGDTIHFKGVAVDPSETSMSMEWTIVFHHQDHEHPFLGPIYNITEGNFTLPTDGELDPVQWYRIYFEAVNEKQLTTSVYVDIMPNLGSFDLYTDPEGLKIFVDDVETSTPIILTGVKGMRRLLYAPDTQTMNGKKYYYMGWNDREAPSHYAVFSGDKIPKVAAYGLVDQGVSSSTVIEANVLHLLMFTVIFLWF